MCAAFRVIRVGMSTLTKTEYRALSLERFFRVIDEIRNKWDFDKDDVCRPWFRGHQRKHWKLVPSLFRIGKYDREIEDEIREEFAIRAPALNSDEALPARDNPWDFYFLMQHYGAPTRLLDWTESPAIALYFALRDNPGYFDSCVWALNAYSINERVLGRSEVIAPSAPGANPRDAKRVKPWLPERWERTKIPDTPVAIFPTHIARRISSQKSCFTVHGKLEDGFRQFIKGSNPCLNRIVIPAHTVKNILLELQDYGVDETTIFPDLEGLGRALATAYRDSVPDLPHKGVYASLKPSSSSRVGIGVFAIKRIPKSAIIFAGENEEVCWKNESALPRARAIRKLYDDFSIIKKTRYGCPVSFNRLTPAWFMSNSKRPNTRIDENYDFIALRNIRGGEELTVDFSTFTDDPA